MLESSLLPYCSISELTRVALDCLSGADKWWWWPRGRFQQKMFASWPPSSPTPWPSSRPPGICSPKASWAPCPRPAALSSPTILSSYENEPQSQPSHKEKFNISPYLDRATLLGSLTASMNFLFIFCIWLRSGAEWHHETYLALLSTVSCKYSEHRTQTLNTFFASICKCVKVQKEYYLLYLSNAVDSGCNYFLIYLNVSTMQIATFCKI